MNLTFSTHLKLLKNIIGARSCDLSKIDQIQKIEKSKIWKIEKSNLISIENFHFLDFRIFDFRKFSIEIKLLFSIFRFSIFRFFESDRSLTGHSSSELRLYFLIILGALKRGDSCTFNAPKIMHNKIPTAKRQHQTWAKKSVALLCWNDKRLYSIPWNLTIVGMISRNSWPAIRNVYRVH